MLDGIELWFIRTEVVREYGLMGVCEAILQPEERAQQQRMVFEKNRQEYLVTRALCRAVLARRQGCSPSELRFLRNAYGRPALDPPSTLRFNLTNTVDLVAIAVADGREVGIDAEPLGRADAILEVAPTVFTAKERAILAGLPLAERRLCAVRLWTLKEAYMKARGMGFSLPVEHFELDPTSERPTLHFLVPLGDLPSRWQFEVRVIGDHMVAACFERLGELRTEMSVQRADLVDLLSVGASGLS